METFTTSFFKSKTEQKVKSIIGKGNVLIVVPPFYNIGFNTLGPYLLQAIAKEQGHKVDVLHLDLILADIIGVEVYKEIQESPIFWMLGERMFSRSAYGLTALGEKPEKANNQLYGIGNSKNATIFLNDDLPYNLEKYFQVENICFELIQLVSTLITQQEYKVVGVSLGFCNQINATVALLNGVKAKDKSCTTIIGGSYCEGEKAEGLFSLSKQVDYIFEGESENSFVNFLNNVKINQLPKEKLISAQGAVNLEQAPIADYKAYMSQVKLIMGDTYYEKIVRAVWYETNRGCWWAEKAKCTFCGIAQIGFRQKSIAKITQDIQHIKNTMPGKHLFFTDLIMSDKFPDKLLEKPNDLPTYPDLGMQMKVGRTVEDVWKLRQIKALNILPGIESFSTKLLKKLKKGTTGKQNLFFLRNTASFDISTQYFLLWGVPGDEASDYQQLLDLIPLIKHLQPPREFAGMQIARDAPYFMEQEHYNIQNMRYWQVYDQVFPKYANKAKFANYFIGEFDNYTHQNIGVIKQVAQEIDDWKKKRGQIKLHMMHMMGRYMIHDSRGIQSKEPVTLFIEEDVAKVMMRYQRYVELPALAWAVEHKLGINMDGWYVPLVTALPELLLEFEEKSELLVNL